MCLLCRLAVYILVCMSNLSKYCLTPMYLYVLLTCFGSLHVDMCVSGCVAVYVYFPVSLYISLCV